jgi:hypothetical protein
VSTDLPSDGSRRARPLADAPVDALLARADELARRWAIALIVARPLAQMTDVPLEELAREAPELCAQVARALRSDAELAPLRDDAATPQPGTAVAAPASAALAALAASGDARSAVSDIEALRGVVWEAALGELPDATARQVADLSDRLAFVCAALLGTLLARFVLPGTRATDTPIGLVAPPPGRVLYRSPTASAAGRRAVLIDERAEPAAAPAGRSESPPGDRSPAFAPFADTRETPPPARTGAARARTAPRARPWDIPLRPRSEADRPVPRDTPQQAPGGTDAADPVMRVTRGPGVPVDERA